MDKDSLHVCVAFCLFLISSAFGIQNLNALEAERKEYKTRYKELAFYVQKLLKSDSNHINAEYQAYLYLQKNYSFRQKDLIQFEKNIQDHFSECLDKDIEYCKNHLDQIIDVLEKYQLYLFTTKKSLFDITSKKELLFHLLNQYDDINQARFDKNGCFQSQDCVKEFLYALRDLNIDPDIFGVTSLVTVRSIR